VIDNASCVGCPSARGLRQARVLESTLIFEFLVFISCWGLAHRQSSRPANPTVSGSIPLPSARIDFDSVSAYVYEIYGADPH